MKNNFKKISAVLMAGALMAPQAFAQTKSLEERVAELEANQSLNIFNFSGIFTTRYDDIIKAKQTDPAASAIDNKDLNYMRMRFQFNIDANVSKYIKFYSRLTTSKMFNSLYQQGSVSSVSTGDLGAPNTYENSSVVLEKAYADLTIPDTSLTLSVGRLPTTDGQPANYLDGRARMGTYPLLAYNSYFDGLGLTYRIDQYMPKDNKLAFRVLFTPGSQVNVGTSGVGAYYHKPTSETGVTLDTLVPMGAAQIDYSLNNTNWVDNFGVVLQYLSTGSIYVPGAAAAGVGNSSLNLQVKQWTLATEFNGIANSNFDLSASYLYSTTSTNGTWGAVGGFGNSTGANEDFNGGNTLISARYRFPTWIIGAEWAHGEKNSDYFATAEQDLTNFYGTTGNGYHLYVTKKFTETLSLRLGYMYQKFDHTNLSIGPVTSSDLEIQTGYANMRLDF